MTASYDSDSDIEILESGDSATHNVASTTTSVSPLNGGSILNRLESEFVEETTNDDSDEEDEEEDDANNATNVSQSSVERDWPKLWKKDDLAKKDLACVNRFHHKKVVHKLNLPSGSCCYCGHDETDGGVVYGALKKPIVGADFAVHELCLMLASDLEQNEGGGPLWGYHLSKVFKVFDWAKKWRCVHCKRMGATIRCQWQNSAPGKKGAQCRVRFHLPCGRKNASFSVTKGAFPTFCQTHASSHKPVLKERIARKKLPFATHNRITTILCGSGRVPMKSVQGEVLRTTCCSRVNGVGIEEDMDRYYHYQCVQKSAYAAGYWYVRCPLLSGDRKKDLTFKDPVVQAHAELFRDQIEEQGIYIPMRDAAWEEDGSQEDLSLDPVKGCFLADKCLCPNGSEFIKSTDYGHKRPSWELLKCQTCGSQGVHRGCAGAPWTQIRHRPDVDEPAWHCADCKSG